MKNDLPSIERYELSPENWIHVVRCDTIPGGFKRLAIEGVYTQSKANNLVFATNSLGTGALALTLSLEGSGKHPILFLSKSDSVSPNLALCKEMGATLDFSGEAEPFNSNDLRKEALDKYGGVEYEILPLGLENEKVRANIIELAKSIFSTNIPQEIWVATASGLTIRSLQVAFPSARFHAVLVKGNHPDVGKAEIHIPKETFKELARVMPPYPSNPNYDAKAWGMLVEKSRTERIQPGTFIFNVA